jgi:hypothetical protein
MRTITTTVRTGMRIMSIPNPPSRLSRRVLRRIWRITRWPLAVLVVLVISPFAINAFDDRLTPLAQEMLKSPDNPFRDDQNLYVLLAGLDAPAGESVLERGQRNIREFSAAYSSKPVGTSVHPGTGRTPDEEALRIEKGVLTWNPLEMSVWDWARDDAAGPVATNAARRRHAHIEDVGGGVSSGGSAAVVGRDCGLHCATGPARIGCENLVAASTLGRLEDRKGVCRRTRQPSGNARAVESQAGFTCITRP